MEVSVIVPARNAEHTLPGCLAALDAQVDAPPFEVIVVDNGSTDGTGALVRPPHRLVVEPRRGSYAARNAGIAVANGDVLAFTDADCIPDPRWLAAAAVALERAPLVGGRVEVLLPEHPNLWEVYDAAAYLDQEGFVEREGFAATANLFVRREVVGTVGPFHPALVSSGDWELCRRAGRAGFRVVYAPDALVHHHPRRTLVETWRLNRRLGEGWRDVPGRPPPWRDEALRWQLPSVMEGADGRARRRWLALAHAVALAGRWWGRGVTGRPRQPGRR